MKPVFVAAMVAGCCLGCDAAAQSSLHQIERGIGIMRDLGVVPGAPSPPPQQAPPQAAPPARSPAPALSRDDVRELQRGLIELGYLSGAADGIAGPATRRAISGFEADRGLPVTGAATPRVLSAVRQASGAPARTAPAGPPRGAGGDLASWLGRWEGFVVCAGAGGARERLPMRLDVRSGAARRLPGRMQAGAGREFDVTVEITPATGAMAILPEAAVAQAPRAALIALEGQRDPATGRVAGTVLGQCESFEIGRPG